MKRIQILVISLLVIFSSKIYGQQSENDEKEKIVDVVYTPEKRSTVTSDSLQFSFHRRNIYVNPYIGFFRDSNPYGIGLEFALNNYFGLQIGIGVNENICCGFE